MRMPRKYSTGGMGGGSEIHNRAVKALRQIRMTEPRLTRAQLAADVVTEFCGSWRFIIYFSLLVAGWMIFGRNLGDAFPWLLMNLFLTVVSTFQSPLIMMSQNRQMERDRDAVRGLHEKLDELKAIIEARK